MIYLRSKQHEAALRELREVEKLENIVFGADSVQVAKTHRVIGTIKLIVEGDNSETNKYFAKAFKIFEE